jgi:o-succinylbenzoate synthase
MPICSHRGAIFRYDQVIGEAKGVAPRMRIRKITLREVEMKLIAPFEISNGVSYERRIVLVEADVDGVTGWAECVAGEAPQYSPETVETAWHIIRDHLWPLLKPKEFTSASEVFGAMESVRGHNMAKGALEAALWDAEAKQKGIPLWQLLGGTRQETASGVSIGIKDSLNELAAVVKKEIDAGYQRIKIKIKPGKELDQVKRLRQDFPKIKLMVDANSAYRLEDWELLKQLDGFYLMMIEQPLGWDDIYSHAELQKKLSTPICLDECIHTFEQARAAIAFGACKIINLKLGRVGGFTAARRIHDLCEQKGIPVWCGGMLESGIGRAHNIALSSLSNFTLPGDVSASRRYWAEDIIEPEVTVSAKGTIQIPTGPGIGFEPRLKRIEKLTTRTEQLV